MTVLADQPADKLPAAQRRDKSNRQHGKPPRQLVATPVIADNNSRNDRRATARDTLDRAQHQ
jgi:hypothetical protein